MARGIKKKFKQPICYYFVQGTTQTPFLVQCIKEVLGQLSATGLSVIGTVSDQGSTNVAAINYFKKRNKKLFSIQRRRKQI